MAKSNDPRTLLKKEEEPQEQIQWSARIQEFGDMHAERIWDLAFSKAIEVALADSNRGKGFDDRLRILASNTKVACVFADKILQVYAEHRKDNNGVFVAAAEIMNQPTK
jgi:hypothetical protein